MARDYRNMYEYCEEEKEKDFYDMTDEEQNQVIEEYEYETSYEDDDWE